MGVAVTATLVDGELGDQIIAVITLSMAVTPLLLKLLDLSQSDALQVPEGAMEELDASDNAPVIIAGFGRVGQIVGRILEQENIPFTSLDPSPDQIDLSARYGHKTYYGDATRADVLRAAGAHEAKILVVAVDDPETSVRVVENVKRNFSHLKVYARARNRPHALDLIEGEVDSAVRETLECGLQLGSETLQALGRDISEATQSVETFRTADFQHLLDQQANRADG